MPPKTPKESKTEEAAPEPEAAAPSPASGDAVALLEKHLQEHHNLDAHFGEGYSKKWVKGK